MRGGFLQRTQKQGVNIDAIAWRIDVDVIDAGHRDDERFRGREIESLTERFRIHQPRADFIPRGHSRRGGVVEKYAQEQLVIEAGEFPETQAVGGFARNAGGGIRRDN